MLRKLLSLVSTIFLASCTAGSQGSVVSKFPPTIEIEDFLFFETSSKSNCTFAEVITSPTSFIDQSGLRQTQENLERLKVHQKRDPRVRFQFPDAGFAYFPEKSIADVAADLDLAGDPDLGYDIGNEIFSGKKCWNTLREQRNWQKQDQFSGLISTMEGTVIIGSKYRHTAIVFFPKKNRAYYFGP
ncbi:hypothetical protein ACQU0X_32830 [Pseudovibrio ascidiaceicola]|uniref:hypothetical protein n=1 Tax=Pseudovibrio ascidiaceicola TaxID=285279 RepID=UPI003D35C3B0